MQDRRVASSIRRSVLPWRQRLCRSRGRHTGYCIRHSHRQPHFEVKVGRAGPVHSAADRSEWIRLIDLERNSLRCR